MKTLIATLLICLLAQPAVFAQDSLAKPAKPQSEAKLALEKLKTFAGAWHGEIMRIPIDFSIRAASSGTAVVHEGNTEGGGPPNHEITMFYVDGERLLATHYCDAGNRSNMEGKMSPDGKTIKFSFLEVIGSTRGGYMKEMALTTVDADHHIVEVLFVMPDSKPIPLRGEFTKKK
ncbi:MAG: hypothetical protein ACAH95_15765 [Fimbriimonas sp.]